MKPIPRNPIRYDIFSVFDDFCRRKGLHVSTSDAREAFAREVGAELELLQSAQERLRGLQGQAMFQALVVELGATEFLKQEDAGGLHASRPVQPPDFRISLPGGSSMLVEVKDTDKNPFTDELGIKKTTFERIKEYARLVRTPLRIAIFWRQFAVWTLVAPDRFKLKKRKYRIPFTEAYMHNEMYRIGDALLATATPLRFRVEADPSKPSTIGDDGAVSFTIGDVKLFCADEQITDQPGKKLALFFIFYGNWQDTQPVLVQKDGRVEAVEMRFVPAEEEADPDLYIVGALSTMHARMFRFLTEDAKGALRAASADADSGRLARLAPSNFPFGQSGLRLWIFSMRPKNWNESDQADDA